MVALGATGLPPGPTLGVKGRPVALAKTVTPGAGTGMEEEEGKIVAESSSDGCPVAGVDGVAVEVGVGNGAVTDGLETMAVVEDPEGIMLEPSDEVEGRRP